MYFSIVIPSYNASKYIKRCITSILNQGFKDYEILIIDDGSTDNTKEVISESYGDNDHIKYIYSPNRGVSNARNIGIENACGDYLVFLDSDDWFESDYLKSLYILFTDNNCDGIIFNYLINNGNDNLRKSSFIKKDDFLSRDDLLKLFFLGKISNNPWDKVFKREIYIKNNIRFPLDISMGEDAFVVASLLKNCQNVKLNKDAFINYMQDTGGVTKSPNINHLEDLDIVLNDIISLFKGHVEDKDLEFFYIFQMSNLVLDIHKKELNKCKLYDNLLILISKLSLSEIIFKPNFFLIFKLYIFNKFKKVIS